MNRSRPARGIIKTRTRGQPLDAPGITSGLRTRPYFRSCVFTPFLFFSLSFRSSFSFSLCFALFPFLRHKADLLCEVHRAVRSLGADPPGKHLQRDTFSYLNEQSARLISALSRYTRSLDSPIPFTLFTYYTAKTQNQTGARLNVNAAVGWSFSRGHRQQFLFRHGGIARCKEEQREKKIEEENEAEGGLKNIIHNSFRVRKYI